MAIGQNNTRHSKKSLPPWILVECTDNSGPKNWNTSSLKPIAFFFCPPRCLSKFIFSHHFYKCNLQRQMNHVSVIKRHQKKDVSKNTKEEHVRDFHFKKHEIRFSLGVLSHFHCSIQKVSAEANKFARTYRIDVRFQGHFSELMIIVIDTSSHLQVFASNSPWKVNVNCKNWQMTGTISNFNSSTSRRSSQQH